MNKVTIALFLILSLASLAVGQSYRELMAKAREIKLLESTRDDVRRILAEYNTDERSDHFQRYYNHEVNIQVYFSDGTCSDDPEDDNDSVIWDIGEWKVTRIEIEPDYPIAIEDSGSDLSKFTKEQRYRDSPIQHIHHDKARGVAVETDEDAIETIIFFPPTAKAKKLCKGSRRARDFYSHESWYNKKLKNRLICDWINKHADVEDLTLSATEVEATSNKTISVTTNAVDPENDVLTYNYTASAGRIVGNGSKVVWDLTGVKAGTYTITAGVDYGAGIIGKTITKTITVK